MEVSREKTLGYIPLKAISGRTRRSRFCNSLPASSRRVSARFMLASTSPSFGASWRHAIRIVQVLSTCLIELKDLVVSCCLWQSKVGTLSGTDYCGVDNRDGEALRSAKQEL